MVAYIFQIYESLAITRIDVALSTAKS